MTATPPSPDPRPCCLVLGEALSPQQASDLSAAGLVLVHDAVDAGAKRPDLVLIGLGPQGLQATLLSQAAAWCASAPAVAWAPHGVAEVEGLAELGVAQLWWVWPSAAALPAQIELALAAGRRVAAWRERAEQAEALQRQLDDRKWTERAKGLLMKTCDLDEDAAFRLLRDTAMHTHLRLGEVARGLVEAAGLAEALNLAGQQRMLSQRLVKLLAQRVTGIEPHRTRVLLEASRDRVDANLARLRGELPELQRGALRAVDEAWLHLRGFVAAKPLQADLLLADAAADGLLHSSERLAEAIVLAGAGRPLRLVNLCGRQRMLSQRLAKEALLASLWPQRAAQIVTSLDEFEAGLQELEAAPLSSAALRAALTEVRETWRLLLAGLRQGGSDPTPLARNSELLLEQLDALTEQIQLSLQVVLG